MDMSKAATAFRFLLPILSILAMLSMYSQTPYFFNSKNSHQGKDALEPSRPCSSAPFQEVVRAFVHQGRKPTAIVTGAAGFIGSHIAEICQRDLGMQVVAVDDLSGGKEENLEDFKSLGGVFVQGDLRDTDFVNTLFETHGPFDYVYHIAAYAAEGLSHFIRHYNYENNVLASVHLINACVNQEPPPKGFIFTSSIAAFGTSDGNLPLRESSPMRPEDPYGIAKLAVELDLQVLLLLLLFLLPPPLPLSLSLSLSLAPSPSHPPSLAISNSQNPHVLCRCKLGARVTDRLGERRPAARALSPRPRIASHFKIKMIISTILMARIITKAHTTRISRGPLRRSRATTQRHARRSGFGGPGRPALVATGGRPSGPGRPLRLSTRHPERETRKERLERETRKRDSKERLEKRDSKRETRTEGHGRGEEMLSHAPRAVSGPAARPGPALPSWDPLSARAGTRGWPAAAARRPGDTGRRDRPAAAGRSRPRR